MGVSDGSGRWAMGTDEGAGGRDGKMVIAIDPGRVKSGIALVHKERGALERRVVATERLGPELQGLAGDRALAAIVLGDRTGSKAARRRLQAEGWEGRASIVLVDEHRSSDEARRKYWRDHPPRGWRRLLPASLQTPPNPFDDYVAVILAERYFAGQAVVGGGAGSGSD